MTRLPLAAALMLAAFPAQAHKLKVFAGTEGAAIVGTAYFAGGAPARDSAGRLLGADGSVLAQFRTGADGGFRLTVGLRQDYRVAIDSGDGHVAEATVAAAELPAGLAPGAAPAAQAMAAPAAPAVLPDHVEAAVARQILPLRRQLDAMEERARFSDIMGGIGTIFGVFGVFAWVAARRSRRP